MRVWYACSYVPKYAYLLKSIWSRQIIKKYIIKRCTKMNDYWLCRAEGHCEVCQCVKIRCFITITLIIPINQPFLWRISEILFSASNKWNHCDFAPAQACSLRTGIWKHIQITIIPINLPSLPSLSPSRKLTIISSQYLRSITIISYLPNLCNKNK